MDIQLSTQAKIVVLAQLLIIVSILLPYGELSRRLGAQRFIFALLYAGISVLIVYNTNCLVTGKCFTWAYIVALLTLFGAIGTLISTFKKPKNTQTIDYT